MIINIQDDILKLDNMRLLDRLLEDKTTKGNIMWATDAYDYLGEEYERNKEMTTNVVTGYNTDVIKTRARKEMEHRNNRTKTHAEVFTPLWVCKMMNDNIDDPYDKKKGWQEYVDTKHLEITCGEAPFLISRYDVETGEALLTEERIGILDRKLRAVNENVKDEDEWINWSLRAYQSTYGYEFQGDNVLIARVNLLMSFEEYMKERWKRKPTIKEYDKIANTVAWNVWQMDGLTGTIPYYEAESEFEQLSIFKLMMLPEEEGSIEKEADKTKPLCKIYNWRRGNSITFSKMREEGRKMKFDYIIGNPPYQEEQVSNDIVGSQKNFSPSIYHYFMDETYKIAEKVELIHPARFLFNAGNTPKAWNNKMLNDIHFKVLMYESDSNKIFPTLSVPIKGGIAISYRDAAKNFGAIHTFTPFKEMNVIIKKVIQTKGFKSLTNIIYPRTSYRLTDVMHKENPDALSKLSKGHAYDMASNIFERLPQIFYDNKPNNKHRYIKILGRENNKRIYKYIRRDYVNDVDNLNYYKLLIPQALGQGIFGEAISSPTIEAPMVGHTETFISIGKFTERKGAEITKKYLFTKFLRALLGVLKVTQNSNKPVWEYIPLQDFTPSSDIDWFKSVADIDQQLYKKYGFDEKEIEFIETHVKEMK